MSPANTHHTLEEIEGSTSTSPDESVWHFRSSWSDEPVTVQYTGHAEKMKLFQWYLNQHAANDPLNSSKAGEVEAELADITQLLCNALPRLSAGPAPMLLDILAKDQASTCHSIPWELLEGSVFATERRIMIRRRIKEQHVQRISQRPAQVSETFNIAIIAARAREQDYDCQQAALPLLRLLNDLPDGAPRIKVEVVRPGTFRGLRDYLMAASASNQTPHLIHFDVHGGLSQDSKRAHLYFANGKTKSAGDLANLLKEHDVKLAVLNACESAQAERGLESNLAQTFAKAGLEAVLAMSYQFNASGVPIFVHDFYTQFLSRNVSFMEAAWSARCALRKTAYRKGRFGLQVKLQDWFVPVVYCSGGGDPVASASGRVSRVQRNQAMLPSGAESLRNALHEIQGRDKDVLQLETKLIENSRKGRGRLLCLEGKLGIGKTSLLRHVQWWWSSTGMVTNTIYFDMTNHQNKGPEEVCEAILQKIGHANNAGQLSSQQELCSFLSRGMEPSTTTPGIPLPRPLLILDHFYIVQWPLPKKMVPTDAATWAFWKSFLDTLSQSGAYTIVSSCRWPWLLDDHETSAFPVEMIHFLQPRRLSRPDALTQIGSQGNANALMANPQDQEHLDIVLTWCESYPPLLTIIEPLMGTIGAARVSEALTSGQDLFCYPKFSRRAVEKLPPYDKAQKFWNGIPSRSRKQLLCLAPFHNYIPRYVESYFRSFAENDLERQFGRLDFVGKYAADHDAIKAAGVQMVLPGHLEIASKHLMFITLLKSLGLIRAEVMTGSDNEATGADGTLIHSIHPVFSLFLRRQARKKGYLTKPGSKAPTKKSLCLERTFVDYHEGRVIKWIQEHEAGALNWDYSREMLSGKESFMAAMDVKLRRPVGTFEYESMPAFLYWCYKTSGEGFRAETAVSSQYLAKSAETALDYACTALSRSLSTPGARLTWSDRFGEIMQLYTWLAIYFVVERPDRTKFDELMTNSEKVVTRYNRLSRAGLVDCPAFAGCKSMLDSLKAMRDGEAPTSASFLTTLPTRTHGASTNAAAASWGIIGRSVAVFDRLSAISTRALCFGYWDLQARLADIDTVCADLDSIIVDLALSWPEFLSSLDSEMLATIRCLGFEDTDDNTPMPDATWDRLAHGNQTALQPPNYASKCMAGIREGKSIAEAKEAFDTLWREWLSNSSRAHGNALLDIYATVENDTHRTNIENASLVTLSLMGDWGSANELLNCLLIPERHCRIDDLSETDFTRLARWHYQKAICAYHLAAWDTSLEHLSTILLFESSRGEVAPKVLFDALLLLVILEFAAPGTTRPTMLPTKALYYALLIAYSNNDDPIYAQNGTLLSLLLQTASMEGSASVTDTILPIEHEMSQKERGSVLGTASPQAIPQRIETMELLRSTNGGLILARAYLQRMQEILTRPGANARRVFADAETHLFLHDRSCGCAFTQGSRTTSFRRALSVEDLVRSAAWPKFDLKAALVPVVRPQLLCAASLKILWLQNRFKVEPNYVLEHERELEIYEYLGRWHGVARDGA